MAASDDLRNPSAPDGKSWKYALRERERRFLLARRPDGEVIRTADITDRYLSNTRLRVRMSVERTAAESRTIYKLTQKIPDGTGAPGLITTTYLNEPEYTLLCTVPARQIRKVRLSIPPFGIDVFAPPLEGLVLAEVEFDSDDEMRSFIAPLSTLAEVTYDRRFTGGRLAAASAEEVAADLKTYGVTLTAS